MGPDTLGDDITRPEREYDAEGLWNGGPKRARNPLPRLIAEAMVSFAPARAKASAPERNSLAGKEGKRVRDARATRRHPWKDQRAAVPFGARATAPIVRAA